MSLSALIQPNAFKWHTKPHFLLFHLPHSYVFSFSDLSLPLVSQWGLLIEKCWSEVHKRKEKWTSAVHVLTFTRVQPASSLLSLWLYDSHRCGPIIYFVSLYYYFHIVFPRHPITSAVCPCGPFNNYGATVEAYKLIILVWHCTESWSINRLSLQYADVS